MTGTWYGIVISPSREFSARLVDALLVLCPPRADAHVGRLPAAREQAGPAGRPWPARPAGTLEGAR
ncbi:hypothetical protein, partial [Frankia nepalensis]|uniref:hypothetical protein n=1 Tax=Frankia nepalensis TaxID=1836974 RepID=UPI001EE3DFFB